MYRIALAACVAFTLAACDNNSRFDLNEAKTSYMEQTLPQVKKIRDQVVFQIKVCDENVNKLEILKSSFQKQESKALVQAKIDQIIIQKKSLAEHVNKIDTEVEKGLALQTFNSIDGGGIRHDELNQIARDAQKSVSNAQTINSSIAKEYGANNLDPNPPKAIPVENSASTPEVNKPKQQIPAKQIEQTEVEDPLVTIVRVNRRIAQSRDLPKLKASLEMFEQQLYDARRRNDVHRSILYEEQVRFVSKKISEIESEMYNQR